MYYNYLPFPEPEKYFDMTLDERRESFLKAHPQYVALEEKLLARGGKRIIYLPAMPSPEIFEKGIFVNPKITPEFQFVGQAHNASPIIASGEGDQVWTGFSLRPEDGYWRSHTWVALSGEFYEVTGTKFEVCFGVEVPREYL